MSLTEICRQVGVHNSKAFSILNTLQEFGLVRRNPNKGGYSLGPGLIKLSRKMLDNLNVPRLAEPILEDLARKARATAAMGLISDDKAFVVAQYDGAPDLGIAVRIGHRAPMAAGSHGKAIASHLSKQELNDLLRDHKPYFHGTPDKFDRKRFDEELEQCRRDGVALDLGEIRPGLNTVAAPVLGPNNKPIGYVIVAGLFTEEEARNLGPLVAEAGRTLSEEAGATMDRRR